MQGSEETFSISWGDPQHPEALGVVQGHLIQL